MSELPTDGIMFNGKNKKESLQVAADIPPASEAEIESLQIEDDFDSGGDPYNRTGSFVAINVPEDG